MMSWLARQDGYDPNALDVPLDQGTNVGWANRMGEILTTRPTYDEQTVLHSTASPLVNITEGDIGRATEAAMGVSGGGMKIETPRGIRAYHSSPHDITPAPGHPLGKFDLAKIGSGEGAQAYGHGLYFAESPAVSGQGGQYWQQFANRFGTAENSAAQHLAQAGFDRQKAAQTLRDMIANPNESLSPHNLKTVQNIRQEAVKLLESGKPVGPRTYEVNINADPAHMLDWDKPFASPGALEAFASKFDTVNPTTRRFLEDYSYANTKAGRALPDGEDIFRELKALSSPKQFSNEFREAGIPGIKYLDQGSRALPGGEILGTQQTPQGWISSIRGAHPSAFNGGTIFTKSMPFKTEAEALAWANEKIKAPTTSNYVIFDPNIIRIDKKYAVPGAIGAGGMGALAAQDQYEEVY